MIDRTLFRSINVSAQGLSVQRTRMNVIAENLANVDTTRTEDGSPYRRKIVQVAQGQPGQQSNFVDIFQQNRIEMAKTSDAHISSRPFKSIDTVDPQAGVHVRDIAADPSPFRQVFDPAHPEANSDGFVQMPNINPIQEMMEMITASRAFEANITALNNSKEMIRNALKI